MFINQEIIAVIFRLINFILLIGIAFVLFKKHVLPDLYASIIRKTENENNLLAQQTALETQQVALDILLKEDLFLCAGFKSKIDEWKRVTQQEVLLHEKEHNKIIRTHQNRIQTITLHQEHNRIKTIVTKAIVADLKKSLSLHFNNKKQNTEYLDSIFNFMNEKIK